MRNPSPARKAYPPAATGPAPAGVTGLLLAAALSLMAAQCEHEIDFPGFVAEVCTDNTDNDEDGKADCDDTDCEIECRVEVAIDQPPAFIDASELRLTGTHSNANSIAISVTPDGNGGNAVLSGNRWEFTIAAIGQTGSHTVTAVATSASARKDTALVTFEKR